MKSEREMRLHKMFGVWDELTTFTRYLSVLLLGIMMYDFGLEIALAFSISLLLNGYSYYSMKSTLGDIIKERKLNS